MNERRPPSAEDLVADDRSGVRADGRAPERTAAAEDPVTTGRHQVPEAAGSGEDRGGRPHAVKPRVATGTARQGTAGAAPAARDDGEGTGTAAGATTAPATGEGADPAPGTPSGTEATATGDRTAAGTRAGGRTAPAASRDGAKPATAAASLDGHRTTTAGTTRPDAAEGAAALFPGGAADRYGERWRELQAGFVDDPREAVRGADALVGEVMDELARTCTDHRRALEQGWSGGDADGEQTERMRLALRRYRAFFHQLLGTRG
ncbi:hypothetical protein [Allonocardiopsis opalescens]|uniref:Uncharacterized protein n=1 Tax=Allonocardiopsis opalescens TaxID=1144618 RepID=A0A2T0Q486_9ACTN|nr:hypothetical protein [Allonocardiopsis opalescens]PRX98614.1 hypothetical protein CLV72_104192 [Allonocardiopsis opalescens]